MKTKLSVFCLFLISAASSLAQGYNGTQQKDNRASAIKQTVQAYVDNNVFAGSLLVANSGNLLYKDAFGFSDRKKQKAFQSDSIVPIASLSKTITSAVVLMLVEQKKLSLADSVASFLPQFGHGQSQQITLEHLLSHRSGIPDHFSIEGWFEPDFHASTSDEDFVAAIASLPLLFAPGSDYQYSNPGYFVLGKIIEKVAGRPYPQVFQELIFAPLGMRNTSFVFNQPDKSAMAYQWSAGGGYRQQVRNNMRLFGAGAAIQSSVEDLYLFQKALHEGKLLSDTSLSKIFNQNTPYSWRIRQANVRPNQAVTLHSYNGKFDGYSSMLTRFVEDDHTIIILSNIGTSYALKQQLTSDIAASLYDLAVPTREKDPVFVLTNSLVQGDFQQQLKTLGNDDKPLDENALTSLAFETLWSGLANQSLSLFAFIQQEFADSTKAAANLAFACDHRLTAGAKNKTTHCTK